MKRFYILPAVFFVLLSVVLIGCGGGGGGGGSNPVATTGDGQLVSLTGKVLLANVPQAGVSVYLYRADEAEIAGLAEQYTAKASVRGSLLPDSSTNGRTTVTDGEGMYRFDGVPEGEYTLMAQKSATERAALTRLVLSAVSGSVTTKDASLQPTSDIAGTISVSGVTDLTGGRVYLLGTSFTSITDSAGNFKISYVPTGTSFQLMADFGGAVLSPPMTIEAVSDATTGSPALTLPLVLSQPLAETGNIVGTATRTLFAPGDETDHAGTLVYLMRNGIFLNLTETNVNGVYRFLNLPATSPNNTYQIRFASPNYVASPGMVDVTVSPNTYTPAQPVSLMPKILSAVLGRLRGRVQKQSFMSLEQETHAVLLRLATGTTPSDRVEFNVQSDDAGYFLFTSIPVGTYTLSCADPNYVFFGGPFQREVRTPINDLTAATPFQLIPASAAKRLGGLNGRVVRTLFVDAEEDGDLLPLKIATGTPGQTGYFEKITMTDPAGNFAFIGIPVGTYSLYCGDIDYIFSPPSPVATVVAAIPALNNGQFNLMPNPAAGGYGRLVATISMPIAFPNQIRVTLVSQTTPANDREVSTIPFGAGQLHIVFARTLPADSYLMHLEQSTGFDIAPHGPIGISANAVTVPASTFPIVNIRPTISSISTATNQITVTGASFTPEYRIELSHLGQEPWQQIPTSLTAPVLNGDTSAIRGGRYALRVMVPNVDILQASYPSEVGIAPNTVQNVTAFTTAQSVVASWTPLPGITQYEVRIFLTGQPNPLQVVKATEAIATFTGLEPNTAYDISIYSVADGLFSLPATLASVMTKTVQMNAQATFHLLALQGGLASDSAVASGSIIYILDTLGANKYLHSINTLNNATQSVMLPGTVGSATKIFSGNIGLYVTENESGVQAIRIYDPVTLSQTAFVKTFPDSSMIQGAYSAATDRVYCVRTSGNFATMTELLPNFSTVVSETALPNFYMSPTAIKCEASRNGVTVGYSYDYFNSGFYEVFHGFFTSSRTTSGPLNFSPASTISLQGGPSGNFFLLSNSFNGFNTLYEFSPTLNKQFVVSSERQLPTSAGVVMDGVMNRWIMRGTTVSAFDAADTPLRSFSVAYWTQSACYDPSARKVFALNFGDATLRVSAFLADF